MPTLSTAARTAQANALNTFINTGTGTADIRLLTAGSAVVATIPLPNPAFTVSGGVLTLAGVPLSDTNAAGNASAVTQFEIRARTSAVVMTGTAATSGAEMTISDAVIDATAAVQVNSLTVTQPAS